MNHQVKPATAVAPLAQNPFNPLSALAGANEVSLRNIGDMKWELMLRDLGKDSPRFTILRADPRTDATTLMIEFPTAIHIPKRGALHRERGRLLLYGRWHGSRSVGTGGRPSHHHSGRWVESRLVRRGADRCGSREDHTAFEIILSQVWSIR
jgi:hypothetical protein